MMKRVRSGSAMTNGKLGVILGQEFLQEFNENDHWQINEKPIFQNFNFFEKKSKFWKIYFHWFVNENFLKIFGLEKYFRTFASKKFSMKNFPTKKFLLTYFDAKFPQDSKNHT